MRRATQSQSKHPSFHAKRLVSVLVLALVTLALPLTWLRAQNNVLKLEVRTTRDSGNGSLRAALEEASGANQPVEITFNADNFPVDRQRRIELESALPPITNVAGQPISLSGLIQGQTDAPPIEINGTRAGDNIDGFRIEGQSVTIFGLLITGFQGNGIVISGSKATNNVIYNNIIRDNGGAGILITDGAAANLIGGNGKTGGQNEPNIIFNNSGGGVILSNDVKDNHVHSNYIGTDLSQAPKLGNKLHGVLIQNTNVRNYIGTDGDGQGDNGEGNLITDNQGNGIVLMNASNQIIAGNTITSHLASQIVSNNLGSCGSSIDANAVDQPMQGCGIAIRGNSKNNIIGVFINAKGNLVREVARNIIADNMNHGIYIADESAANNIIAGNLFGMDKDGRQRAENSGSAIYIRQADNTIIGVNGYAQTDLVKRNIISGSKGDGITLVDGANNTQIAGNIIGLQANGTKELNNSLAGIHIENSSNVIIGADATATSNVKQNIISGNASSGIIITKNANNNHISGNLIGTNNSGSAAIANNDHGILIEDGSEMNVIGYEGLGNIAYLRNVISGNENAGILIQDENTSNNVISGNFIGPNIRGDSTIQGINNSDGAGIEIQRNAHDNCIGVCQVTTSGETLPPNLRESFGNVISGNRGVGITLQEASNNHIAGNFIGVDRTGTRKLANQIGILIADKSTHNFIGLAKDSELPDEGNIISGNGGSGVRLNGKDNQNNTLAGNIIGLDVKGVNAIGNDIGVVITDRAHDNLIGVNDSYPKQGQDRNIISGNVGDGIQVLSAASQNVIAGNYIGLTINGIDARGNNGNGLTLKSEASKNRIGTNGNDQADPYERNYISANKLNGIVLDGALENQISGNQIGSNIRDEAKPNAENGVRLEGGSQQNTVGGADVVFANRIRFNAKDGIFIVDGETVNNHIVRNTTALNKGNGVHILDTEDPAPSNNAQEILNNRISNNLIDSNQMVGVLIEGGSPLINGNIITNNQASGIYLKLGTQTFDAVPQLGNEADNTIYANCANTNIKDCAGIFLDLAIPANMSTLEINNPEESNHNAAFISKR